MAGILRYESNNSGGDWWLKDKDWDALEKAGWVVHWVGRGGRTNEAAYDKERFMDKSLFQRHDGHRWLGALAKSACKRFDNPKEGVSEFEEIAHQDPTDIGCGCCGNPHEFQWYDDDGTERYLGLDTPTQGTIDYGL